MKSDEEMAGVVRVKPKLQGVIPGRSPLRLRPLLVLLF